MIISGNVKFNNIPPNLLYYLQYTLTKYVWINLQEYNYCI